MLFLRLSSLIFAAGVFAAGVAAHAAPFGTAQVQSGESDAEWCENSGSSNERERHCEVRELAPVAADRLSISESPNGAIQVTGTTRRDIRVRARVVATAPTADEARQLAGQVEVTLASDGRVRTDGPNTTGRRSWWVSYRAEVRRETDISVDTSNGSITLSDVSGDIEATTSNGSLRMSNLAGNVRGRSSNGSVHVTLDGSRWDGDGLDVRTSNGSAQIEVPEGYNARLVASTGNGSLRVDFPVTVSGRLRGAIDTSLGSGGPTIRIQSSNGSVRVGRR